MFQLCPLGVNLCPFCRVTPKIMKETCHEVLAELGIKDEPLLDMAM